jgi:DNA topoisomerase-2
MRTSSNFDDEEKRTTGGRNGYGAKLANIMSRSFKVDTQDQKAGLSFSQEWTDNMGQRSEPRVRKCTKADFTRVTFVPDYRRFNLTGLDADHIALLEKRAYDLAGTYPKFKVVLNGQRIQFKKGFQDYVNLYLPRGSPRFHERVGKTCEVCVAAAPDEGGGLQHMSFVNGICTSKGGRHVDVVLDQVVPAIVAALAKKKVTAQPSLVRSHLFVFVNALVVNPKFESQSKLTLTSTKAEIAPSLKLSDKFIKRLTKVRHPPARASPNVAALCTAPPKVPVAAQNAATVGARYWTFIEC